MVTLTKSRIEALSDGVFAIAMTLLVLKLEVPEHQHSNEEMLAQILALRPQFLTYVATFLIAGGFWFLHHLTFHFIRHVNAFLVWVNLLYLMFVSLLPFSAGLMGHLTKHPVSQLFYFGNMLAISLLLNLHWYYARRKDFVVDTDPEQAGRLTYRLGLTAVAFAICMISATFSPEYTWAPLWLFLLVILIQRIRRRRER